MSLSSDNTKAQRKKKKVREKKATFNLIPVIPTIQSTNHARSHYLFNKRKTMSEM